MVYLLYVGMGRESSKLYIVMILADLDLYWLFQLHENTTLVSAVLQM